MTQLVEHTFAQLGKLLASQWENGERTCRSEQWYCDALQVSRSPVRKVFDQLEDKEIVRKEGKKRLLLKKPVVSSKETEAPRSKAELFEEYFLSLLSAGKLVPGTFFSELEMAKQANCTTGTVREILQKISSYGVVKKDPRHQWEIIALDQTHIYNINSVRSLYEVHAIECISQNYSRFKARFTALLANHKRLLKKKKVSQVEFRKLDKSFHRSLFEACDNPLIMDHFLIVSLMIHHGINDLESGHRILHTGIQQHVDILEAITSQKWEEAKRLQQAHLMFSSEQVSQSGVLQ
jgi:DNA-binding GntR family transcriptional regulator